MDKQSSEQITVGIAERAGALKWLHEYLENEMEDVSEETRATYACFLLTQMTPREIVHWDVNKWSQDKAEMEIGFDTSALRFR
ncbi:hypothetical protein [Pantoea sp. ME81]|uniref:hypothetical protein n=1 Tax=Pantoea sp. ME81 TaxID=2743935 RepID=UPI0015F5F536|nr:hypothetical protein [Pantoea sp. ME81]